MSSTDDDSSHSGPGDNTVYGRSDYSNGLPLSYLCASTTSEQTIYSQSLLHTGNGLPISCPEGEYKEDQVRQWKSGVVIGDVGFIGRKGLFNVLFNIFEPRQEDRVFYPKQYEKAQPPLEEWEVRTVPDQFPPGTVITSKGLQYVASESPRKYLFTSSCCRAGVLILPDGGSRSDLVDVNRLEPYIEKHALDWYRFANRDKYAGIYNGALHLVTGVDHAPKWATAVFSIRGDLTSDAKFEYDRETCTWPRASYLDPGSLSDDDDEYPQAGTIFVRSVRIALGSALWTRYTPTLSYSEEPRMAVLVPPVNLALRQQRHRFWGVWFRKKIQLKTISDDEPMDPALLVLQIMLKKSPSANVVAAHSSLWDTMTELNVDYPNILDHLVDVFWNNRVELKDGTAVLVPNEPTRTEASPTRHRLATQVLSTLAACPQALLLRRERDQLWKTIYQRS